MSTRDRLTARRRVVCSRVLAEEAQLDEPNGSPSRSRKHREEQRAAIRPPAQYQIGVRRRLRGRWFNLVPADGRKFALVIGSLLGLVALVIVLGVIAASWAPLAMRPLVGRPIRLDAPGTLGDWLGAHLLAMSAGIGILIYQLRRYRGDDYHGRYRMWRAIIVFLLLLSLDSVTHLRDALAATIDATWGSRSVIAGDDVVRLTLLFVGAASALPILAELRRSPLSVFFLLASVGTLALPTALRLGVIPSRPDLYGTWVGASRLLGRALILASALTYLRVLYREVRGMESSNLVARFLKRRARIALEKRSKQNRGRTNDEDAHDEDESRSTRRRWWGWGRRVEEDLVENPTSSSRSKRRSDADTNPSKETDAEREEKATPDVQQPLANSPPKPMSIQRPQPQPEPQVAASQKPGPLAGRTSSVASYPNPGAPRASPNEGPKQKEPTGAPRTFLQPGPEKQRERNEDSPSSKAPDPTRRSWFGWRSKEKAVTGASEKSVVEKTATPAKKEAAKEDAKNETTPPKKGLFGWMNRGRASEQSVEPSPSTTPMGKPSSTSKPTVRNTDDDDADDEFEDNRSGMTRAERKRLKKLQRRGRAA